MTHSDQERLRKILAAWRELTLQMEAHNVQKADVLQDRFTQWAVTTPLYNIGEQANNLSKELQEAYPAVPWKKVSGLRHRLVHNYEGTNWDIIVAILFGNMPQFIEDIARIINDD